MQPWQLLQRTCARSLIAGALNRVGAISSVPTRVMGKKCWRGRLGYARLPLDRTGTKPAS
jgi:hypothetical protein